MPEEQWQFIHDAGAWTWRKIEEETGSLLMEGKAPLPDFSQIIDDAMNFGYRPTTDNWTIQYYGEVTRYRKGKPI
jgi:hypothetical protein